MTEKGAEIGDEATATGAGGNGGAPPEGIDPAGVEAWFEENVPGASPPLRFERISGGRSNLTYLVADAGGGRWALRRPPLGKRLGSAHDMGREHKVISALQGTPVPVPPVVGFCGDEAVNGAPFYVMDFVAGPVLRVRGDAELFPREAARRAIGERVVDTLVAIHDVDPDSVGLGELGRKDDYVARQLHRWYGQWQKSQTRELPVVDDVHRRLAARIPEQGPAAIVHGDYRLDNMILSPSGEVAAVVDWELSTVGDPLADLGWALYFWRERGEPPFAIPVANATALPGFPARADLLERYARRRDLPAAGARWYAALAGWKIAIIMESSYRRHLAGIGDHETFGALEEGVPGLARRALAFARGDLI